MASTATSISPAGTGVVTRAQLAEVVRAIRKCPIIDNHAHPLLKPDSLAKHPLLAITTEAAGDAIYATSTSLAHIRGVRQLAHVLGCGQTWEAVVAAIEQRRFDDYDEWIGECLQGVQTILVDDGLDAAEEVQDYAWHDAFTRSACKRIVRLEAVAGRIVHRFALAFRDEGEDLEELFDKAVEEFEVEIREAIADPEVVGFKSVICYRTGLDIPAAVDVTLAKRSFDELVSDYAGHTTGLARIQHPGLNDLLVHRTAALISEMPGHHKKPIQFHTGLGDNDITLAKSSPSHLQDFIRTYPTVPIVLLHASYPFTRELGYLATVYSNVYADIGEIFPFVSKDGQEKAVRQILELCPWSKILWSTDGHWFPETYLLAILQVREVLESVLCEYVRRGAISWKAAIKLAKDVLFGNSNKLYHLELDFTEWGETTDNEGDVEMELEETDLDIFTRFLRGKQAPDFVRISWTDTVAFPRMRMIPFRKFITSLEEGRRTDIGITKAVFGLLQHDWIAPGFSATGEYRLHPDFSSLRAGPIPGHVSMYGEFREKDSSTVPLCPRTQLQRAQELGAQQGLAFLVGFEIEFVLLERADTKSSPSCYQALTNDGHSWSTSRFFADPKISKLLADIVRTLESMDIFVEQIHPESAPGQFELVLPSLPPVAAVDTLLHTREVIAAMAIAAGYKFTLHPKPFAEACGTAAHAHISISSAGGGGVRKEVYEPFYAGILKHLRGIAAFTCSNPASYERVADGVWAGGRWVTWGTQNRETPLRKIEDSHWEVKCLDGLANAYLAIAALLLAGIHGVATGEELVWADCEIDPAGMTDNDRRELRVTEMLPANLEEALAALEGNEELVELVGAELVEKYCAVKRFEIKFLHSLDDAKRREWIMQRY
uniref:Glutamine synthetase n=1 Tax=Cryphonectria parasitica TaxID=5116 RepID=A0A5P8SV30_CRYPA|nr:glutamine synthetase [Cryphonectria parasitica]